MNEAEVADIRRWLEKSEGLADGRPFTGDRRIDALIEVALELAGQLWVVRRRQAMLESRLAAGGTLPPGALETHSFTPEEARQVRELRTELIATVLRPFAELPIDPPPSGANDQRPT